MFHSTVPAPPVAGLHIALRSGYASMYCSPYLPSWLILRRRPYPEGGVIERTSKTKKYGGTRTKNMAAPGTKIGLSSEVRLRRSAHT
jgi:hypothetical protein